MGFLFVLLILSGMVLLIFSIKKLTFLKLMLSVFSGLAALFSCDLLFSLFGQNMPLNIYTAVISAAGGIPGVILLTLLKLLTV
ncbi:MAG: pro-sigmaK processing inhibitor BofA family protein [Clostridia bacterium]|nr:pro-sigmaK processing inhibitor BofA family protein [Clostridia bacterium]